MGNEGTISNEKLLNDGIEKLDQALIDFMEVKNEIGNEIANKVYKAIRVYEKWREKIAKEELKRRE